LKATPKTELNRRGRGKEGRRATASHRLRKQLTVKAKKQPLSLVLLKIGEQLGIPVDIQNQNGSIVDAEISKLPVEDVVRQLSPHIRLFFEPILHAPKNELCGWFWLNRQGRRSRTLEVECDLMALGPTFCCHESIKNIYLTNNDSRRRLNLAKQNEIINEEIAGLHRMGMV
jgi:hypothetical protein